MFIRLYVSSEYYLKINVYNYAFDRFGSALVSTVTHIICLRITEEWTIVTFYTFHLTKNLFGSLLLFHLTAKINIIFYCLTTVYVLYMFVNSVSVNLLSPCRFFLKIISHISVLIFIIASLYKNSCFGLQIGMKLRNLFVMLDDWGGRDWCTCAELELY